MIIGHILPQNQNRSFFILLPFVQCANFITIKHFPYYCNAKKKVEKNINLIVYNKNVGQL